MTLPDVQSHRSPRPFRLTRVGVTGVVKPLHVTRDGKRNTLVGTFDVFVDLPAEQRGTHMSRNIEVVNRLIDEHVRKETASLEDLASGIAHALLERHEYAAEAEAHVSADYFRERRTPQNHAPTLERYELAARAHVGRNGEERRAIAVAVIGMTACPCAMEGSRTILTQQGHDVEGFPTVTHNQRNIATLEVETGPGHYVEADHLIDIAEASLSAPTYELLKRGDETALVMQAHMNPRFVEDVVREMLHGVSERYGNLPDDTVVLARSEAEESIHKHNAYAERTALLSELRGGS
ncbi:MAG TPA: GTP cyclohydrolase MptA [Candidatus Thermoplasmatota archaeon]|nr:GTP cyclohydrolase MptA [Candidatus Thermoplasmatota archaeon]